MPFLFLLSTHVLGFHYQGEVNSCFWHNCNFENCHFYPAYEVRNQRTGNNDRLTDLNSIPGPFPYRHRWKQCSLCRSCPKLCAPVSFGCNSPVKQVQLNLITQAPYLVTSTSSLEKVRTVQYGILKGHSIIFIAVYC